MRSQEEEKVLDNYLRSAKKFNDENEPIYKGCPNVGHPCFCTGECKKVIGSRPRAKAGLDEFPHSIEVKKER